MLAWLRSQSAVMDAAAVSPMRPFKRLRRLRVMGAEDDDRQDLNVEIPAASCGAGTINVGQIPDASVVAGTFNVGQIPDASVGAATIDVGQIPDASVGSGTINVDQIPDASVGAGTINVGQRRCVARIWACGLGDQCQRSIASPSREFCKQHHQLATSSKGLPHGRIDEPVPADADMCARRCVARVFTGVLGDQCHRPVSKPSHYFCTEHHLQASSSKGLPHGRIDRPSPTDKFHGFAESCRPERSVTDSAPPRERVARSMGLIQRRVERHISVESSPASAKKTQNKDNSKRARACPQPIPDYDRRKCAARIWAGGQGLQCSRTPVDRHDYCLFHLSSGLKHGRIDKHVPEAKRKEFMEAVRVSDGPGDSSCSDFETEPSTDSSGSSSSPVPDRRNAFRACLQTRKKQQPAVYEHSLAAALLDFCCASIVQYLEQNTIFRAAMVCDAWAKGIRQSCYFRSLDLRSVGVWVTARGRRTALTGEAREQALFTFVEQKRFATVTKLDMRGIILGRGSPDRNELLQHVAEHCPLVRHLLLDQNKPLEAWSDIGRYMPTQFARSLLRWWPGIAKDPMIIEGYGRRYLISGGKGGSPYVEFELTKPMRFG